MSIERELRTNWDTVYYPEPEPVVDQAMAPGQQPGDVLVAEAGSRGLPESAYSGEQPKYPRMEAYDPTVREKLSNKMQTWLESMGVDRYKARQNAQTFMGGGSSNLPLTMGIADIIPYIGTGMQTEEAIRLGSDAMTSAQQGNYGTAAVQAGGAALGLIPGAVGTGQVTKKLLPKAGEMVIKSMEKLGTPVQMGIVENTSYRGSHAAPNRDFGATLDDLTGGGQIYPADIYSKQGPRIYGTGMPYDKKAFDIANKAKGNPDAEVTIYRAVPSEVKSTDINRGDWVAITQDYAKTHGESVLRGDYKIISKKVKARDIYTNGDSIQEWGYDPENTNKKPITPIQSSGGSAE